MRVEKDFSPAEPEESEPYSFDFTRDMPDSASITGSAWTLTVESTIEGYTEDPDPSSRIIGSPVITGKVVSQKIGTLQAGNRYKISCKATLDTGAQVILHSFVDCIDPDV